MRNRLIATTLATASVAAAVVGCGSTGLSVRERPGQDYALYMHSMYEQPAGEAQREPVAVRFPLKLGVAQIGEVAPPTQMLTDLRGKRDLFAMVEGLPGVTAAEPYRYERQTDPSIGSHNAAREHLQGMCRMARDMGMTHLLVFGGTINYDTNRTGLSLADLTIVGAFVVPSREIRASARASGALIDLKSESVVLIASADADRTKLTPTAAQDGDELKLMHSIRDDLIKDLTANFVQKCADRRGSGAVATAAGN